MPCARTIAKGSRHGRNFSPERRYPVLLLTTRSITAAALIVWTAVGLLPNRRAALVPASASADQFSAARAMTCVETIAERPHPTGSAEHARVRDYLRAELARLGLPSQVETGIGEFHRFGRTFKGPVENIIARLAGTANTRPVMLAAHYDSVPAGPGASDDASGVATLLETLRALRSGPPLRNDVIFLLTDGEERGLLGSSVFMRDHPWRNEPGVVLNFEARGTSGPSLMFETSPGNAWMVRRLREAAPYAIAASSSYEIYRRMPNDTDLTNFKRGGLAGMNFAFIENVRFYHTSHDDPAHLDLRSLQEDGNYALSLTRIFGNEDLRGMRSGDAVYFATPITPLILYSVAWVLPTSWLLIAALVALSLWAFRRRLAHWLWIAIPLAIVSVLELTIAIPAPGASYLLEWPLLAGVIGFAVLIEVSGSFGNSWALIPFLIAPAAVTLILIPFISMVWLGLGPHAWPIIVALVLLILASLAPQLLVIVYGSGRGAKSV